MGYHWPHPPQPATPDLSRFASIYTALRHRDFRRLWIGTFCSTGGQWIQQATLGWVCTT